MRPQERIQLPVANPADVVTDIWVSATLTRRSKRASRGSAHLSALVRVKRAHIDIVIKVRHHDDGFSGWTRV